MRSDIRKIIKWVGTMAFFAIVPPLFLKFGEFSLREISPINSPQSFSQEFANDVPSIMLAFWGGAMGAIVAHIYERLNGELDSQSLVFSMSRFLFGGILGAASFLVIRSAFLINLLYPKINTSILPAEQLIDYRPIVAISVLCGLIGPSIVSGIKKKAKKKLQ